MKTIRLIRVPQDRWEVVPVATQTRVLGGCVKGREPWLAIEEDTPPRPGGKLMLRGFSQGRSFDPGDTEFVAICAMPWPVFVYARFVE